MQKLNPKASLGMLLVMLFITFSFITSDIIFSELLAALAVITGGTTIKTVSATNERKYEK